MEGDAAARADLLRAKVVDRHGAAHVAVEGERDVVLKWEKVMLEIPRQNIEGYTDYGPTFRSLAATAAFFAVFALAFWLSAASSDGSSVPSPPSVPFPASSSSGS